VTFLLNTNTCIRYLNGRAPGVLARLHRTPVHEVALCSVVKAELNYGMRRGAYSAEKVANQQLFLSQSASLPFDDRAAEQYGLIRAQLELAGKPIGPNDLMIAAIALANVVTLVTHNTNEFGRVAGLRIEDWEM
jgi:tRNA(fMet)-specific endonuclease VapC